MTTCNKLITHGFIIRYITTIISFYILAANSNNNTVHKYIYLILPLLLVLLDNTDHILIHYYGKLAERCSYLFYYQSNDKICDSISYLLLFAFFKMDNILLFFVLYRIIGVMLFCITKNSRWLILFFDFAKEYLVYLFIFKHNYKYLPFFILGKICFEYYFHTRFNANNYLKEKENEKNNEIIGINY